MNRCTPTGRDCITQNYITSSHLMEPHMRIQRIRLNVNWSLIWRNLHDTPRPQKQKVTWYKVINDIVRTNVRLHTINMTPTDKCRHYAEQDTLKHRIIQYEAGHLMWKWTAAKIATILRTAARYIPSDWTLCPTCNI
jgi:hypothetical protein